MVILVIGNEATPSDITGQIFKDTNQIIYCATQEEALHTLENTHVDLVFSAASISSMQSLTEWMDRYESQLVFQAMKRTNHNQVRAARILNITRGALQYKLKKYGYHKPIAPVFAKAA